MGHGTAQCSQSMLFLRFKDERAGPSTRPWKKSRVASFGKFKNKKTKNEKTLDSRNLIRLAGSRPRAFRDPWPLAPFRCHFMCRSVIF